MFNFGKKKEKKEPTCVCNGVCNTEVNNTPDNECCADNVEGICCVKVLGSGCKSCHTLYENAKQAVADAELNIKVEYITDMEKIMEYGVISMPALVVNEKVVSMGKVLKTEEVKKYFE